MKAKNLYPQGAEEELCNWLNFQATMATLGASKATTGRLKRKYIRRWSKSVILRAQAKRRAERRHYKLIRKLCTLSRTAA